MRLLPLMAPILLAAPCLLAACSAASPDPAPSPTASSQTIGAETAAAPSAAVSGSQLLLFTSLPILWSEGGLGDMLSAKAPVHWARGVLEQGRALRPVDNLTQLAPGGMLVMAQPRALAPAENLALDEWVRGGGHLLLIVDPMLDVHSSYGLGDRRRPEAIAMLSPILGRWGLRLDNDERGEHVARWQGHAIPVDEGGLFALTGQGFESDCRLDGGAAEALVADCAVGKGRVLLLADATFLADGDDAGEGGENLLRSLVAEAQRPAAAD